MLINGGNPIEKALKQIFNLFAIEKEFRVLMPERYEELDKWYDEYIENASNFIVVHFKSPKDKKQDKWERDTYRFWYIFFKELGIGYDGSNVINLVNQIGKAKDKNEWHYKLYKYIELNRTGKYKYDSNKSTIDLIRDKDYSFARVSHNSSEEKDLDKQKLSYLVTALRESVLWRFIPGKDPFKILIIDDRLFYSESNEEDENKIKQHLISILKICEIFSIDCYGLLRDSSTPLFTDAFPKVLESLKNGSNELGTLLKRIKLDGSGFKPEELKGSSSGLFFDYLLVDLWHDDAESIRGLGLISELHHKIQGIVRKNNLSFENKREVTDNGVKSIPEILAYSLSEDAETILMAHRMGAAGYVLKRLPESFVLALVRAGVSLSLSDATVIDFLSTNNFSIINRLPRQIVKDLYTNEIYSHDHIGEKVNKDRLEWLRKIPKADLHVHFGTAIPLEWCYILSLISLIHWNDYWELTGKNNSVKFKGKIEIIITGLGDVIQNVLVKIYDKLDIDFRREFLSEFSKHFKISEAVVLKDAIAYLVSLSQKQLNDKQVACLINVMLGRIIFKTKDWKEMYKDARTRIYDLKNNVEDDETCLHTLKYLRDCRYLIRNISLDAELNEVPFCNLKLDKINDKVYKFDPLSEMLSTSDTSAKEHRYGLERYLGASNLVGSSILQFADTLLLASMSIPEWASSKNKKKKENEEEEKTDNQKDIENIVHLELRVTPQGYLMPYDDFKMQDNTIATKMICVGLEYGTKCLLKGDSYVSANVLLSIKRDRERSSISDLIRIAVDMKEEYQKYVELNAISTVESFAIPHVIGLDVAGIERNNLPEELFPYFREAFERCLLSTIHAGETESARSVKDAIFMLSASRIGHGLSIIKDVELKEMVADRSICVELCPKSNQFTNGFIVFSNSKDKTNKMKEYVYSNFRKGLVLSVNTDNPTISHRTRDCFNFAYPLSEEFIWLAKMINHIEYSELSKLEVLRLIYNGFISMFAPEQAKKYIINIADNEILSLLTEEYLDIDMELEIENE